MTETNPNSPVEPSVLDYFKALLTPGVKAPKIPELLEDLNEAPQVSAAPAADTQEFDFEIIQLPWRSLLALVMALGGQLALQPFLHQGAIGGGLYLLAVVMGAWAMHVGELKLPEMPGEAQPQEDDDLSVLLWPIVGGLILLIAGYLAFGGNRFSDLNLLLWFSGIGLMLWAFWYPRPDFRDIFEKLAAFFSRGHWQVIVSWPSLAFALILVVGIFFRVHQFNQVVPEMVSDHAEKLWDVYDVLQGNTKIFFDRNTGREGLQMYLIAFTTKLFNIPLSFTAMKIGTVFLGIFMLPFMYLIGKELGNRTVGMLAMFFSGIAFWLNSMARVALRFILYPAFAAPTLYFLLHGLRTGRRRDFIIAGIFLGIGLHGYTPFRAVPILVVAAFVLFWLHHRSRAILSKMLIWLGVLAFISFIIFLPLMRVWIQYPAIFNQRTVTRLTNAEVGDGMATGLDLVGVFFSNVWNGLLMLNWDSGTVWVNTIVRSPSLDMISGALFVLGCGLLLYRYITKRKWQDLFLLLAVPVLMLPSTLVLAYPQENPSPNRAGGAAVVVFVIIALALEALFRAVKDKIGGKPGERAAWLLVGILSLVSLRANFSMTFEKYKDQYVRNAWNTSEMGAVVGQFIDTIGSPEQAWVVAFPYWVDTRLVAINAGQPNRDYQIWPDEIHFTLAVENPKLFLFRIDDDSARQVLEELYPEGIVSMYPSDVPGHSFYIYFVP